MMDKGKVKVKRAKTRKAGSSFHSAHIKLWIVQAKMGPTSKKSGKAFSILLVSGGVICFGSFRRRRGPQARSLARFFQSYLSAV